MIGRARGAVPDALRALWISSEARRDMLECQMLYSTV